MGTNQDRALTATTVRKVHLLVSVTENDFAAYQFTLFMMLLRVFWSPWFFTTKLDRLAPSELSITEAHFGWSKVT